MEKINSKGQAQALLLKEALNLLIVLIGISILVFLGALLYGSLRDNQKEKQAIGELEEIINRLESLEGEQRVEYLYLAPKDYYFHSSNPGDEVDGCFSDYCLCLCNKVACISKNECKKSDLLIVVGTLGNEELKPPVSLILGKLGESYYIIKK